MTVSLQRSAPILSPTLATHEEVTRRIDAGEDILHLAFGEAGLPVHPLLRDALAAGSNEGGYGPVAGEAMLRRSVAGYYARRGLETDASQIVVGPGSKALLFALLLALDGDLVLPKPAWVSYAAQAALARKAVLRVSIPAESGGIPDPDSLEGAVARARSNGQDPRVLLITHPDNPTGTMASREALARTLEVADSCGLFVIADEIYRDLAYDESAFVSAAELDDANCILTGGLSKSLALGGWRIGVLRVPLTARGHDLGKRVCAIASEIWSCIAAPIAEAAWPTAAFYLYPDLTSSRHRLTERGIDSGVSLARVLLEEFGIAVLAGAAFGDDPEALRFRVAASLLYGANDDARWAALEASSAGCAAQLPGVVEAATRLRTALESVLV